MKADFDNAEELFSRGNQHLEAKDFASAESCFRRAIEIAPDLAEVHVNLGLALENRGVLGEAESSYFRALALDPECVEAYVDLGALLVRRKRFQEAEEVYEAAMRAFPDSAILWSNLGFLHACLKREAEAERCFRTALSLDGNYHKARFNLSYLLMRRGDFEEGLQALESRARNLDMMAHFPDSRWRGETLVGKSLLIPIEAGYGDLIQYSRFVSVLKERGAARIAFVCHAPLTRLFATLTGLDEVVPMGGAISEADWDYWILPFSIPLHCGTRVDSIPAPIPYLRALPDEIAAWRSRIPGSGLRVGLAWRGNPNFENDPHRSIPNLEMLSPLAAVAGVHFISLQKGVGEDEARHPPAGMALFDPSPWIEDFADTAALVTNLDLVISVDTAVAHLAGALGKPCWTLLPYYKTDARWLTDREDSPWYPGTMRLFRQVGMDTWPAVIEEVAKALRDLVCGGPE
ncbi:tetratricopeptide repeat protein [Holophaga foetida]|uniref:tetratricopeptide repeat-containing glycosyltransferase family protein n=1 Tax=Holophaga foetida TaxID=35839 RepID=UPI000247372E|nr:tetratricopeptide repeat protein [Holophaga foetida]